VPLKQCQIRILKARVPTCFQDTREKINFLIEKENPAPYVVSKQHFECKVLQDVKEYM